jgi:carbonic anhydrase
MLRTTSFLFGSLLLFSCAPPPAPAASPAAAPPSAAAHEPQPTGALYAAAEANGQRQSPINIVTGEAKPGQHTLSVSFHSSREHVTNTGHTVKVNYDPGSSIELDGKSYDLQQFHFHTPAEHQLDGVTYPLELHMVHGQRGVEGQYAVIGVLFKQGAADELLAKLVAAAPTQAGATKDDTAVELDVKSLFSPSDGYFHYEGSLTTPPYAETVTWIVSKRVLEASGAQISAINQLEGDNARHIQALGSRQVDAN